MVRPVISDLESVCSLIRMQSFGYFALYDALKQNYYGDFPKSGEGSESKKDTPENITAALVQILGTLGPGDYLIECKANSKVNSNGTATYRFTTVKAPEPVNPQHQFNGLGYVDRVTLESELGRVRDQEKRYYEAESRLTQLKHEIELTKLRAKKSGKKKGNDWVKPLAGLGTAIVVIAAAKLAPEIAPTISELIKNMNMEGDDDETETYDDENATVS